MQIKSTLFEKPFHLVKICAMISGIKEGEFKWHCSQRKLQFFLKIITYNWFAIRIISICGRGSDIRYIDFCSMHTYWYSFCFAFWKLRIFMFVCCIAPLCRRYPRKDKKPLSYMLLQYLLYVHDDNKIFPTKTNGFLLYFCSLYFIKKSFLYDIH